MSPDLRTVRNLVEVVYHSFVVNVSPISWVKCPQVKCPWNVRLLHWKIFFAIIV